MQVANAPMFRLRSCVGRDANSRAVEPRLGAVDGASQRSARFSVEETGASPDRDCRGAYLKTAKPLPCTAPMAGRERGFATTTLEVQTCKRCLEWPHKLCLDVPRSESHRHSHSHLLGLVPIALLSRNGRRGCWPRLTTSSPDTSQSGRSSAAERCARHMRGRRGTHCKL